MPYRPSPAGTAREIDSNRVSPVTFEPTEFASDLQLSPIDPTRTVDYVRPLATEGSPEMGDFKRSLYRENVYVHDAMVAGWLVYSPVDFSIRSEDGAFEPAGHESVPDGIVRSVGPDELVELDSLWQVRFPDDFEGLIIPPVFADEECFEVLPRLVGSAGKTDLTLSLRVRREGDVNRGQPVAQVVPASQRAPETAVRSAAECEVESIRKEVRRQQLYPDVYTQERPQPRFGSPASANEVDDPGERKH